MEADRTLHDVARYREEVVGTTATALAVIGAPLILRNGLGHPSIGYHGRARTQRAAADQYRAGNSSLKDRASGYLNPIGLPGSMLPPSLSMMSAPPSPLPKPSNKRRVDYCGMQNSAYRIVTQSQFKMT